MQRTVDNIVKRVREKKMLLNTEKGKTDVTFFAAGSVDAKWIPKIILYDKEMEFFCSNDGMSTCTNRARGVGSTPDLFVAPSSMASRVSWNMGEDMGSDHLPITIELECEVNATKPGAARPRWKSKGVDWAVFSSEERDKNRLMKTWLRAPTVDEEGTADFSIEELKRAIKHMKTKGAAGPEDIQPTFLKALGQEARSELLTLFTMSFNTGKFPQEWQNAVIIPLLKSGKPSSKVASFRPVSLTSCIIKTLERMIAARISYLAETNNWFSDSRAGFRRGRSCEDQMIRFLQSVSDGFQKKKPERTVMALLDFSQAYDRVWRQDLLLTMLEKGVPWKLLRWIAAFLQNRQGRFLSICQLP